MSSECELCSEESGSNELCKRCQECDTLSRIDTHIPTMPQSFRAAPLAGEYHLTDCKEEYVGRSSFKAAKRNR